MTLRLTASPLPKLTASWRALAAALVLNLIAVPAEAGGPLGIDHRLERDDQGIWARRNQLWVQDASAIFVLGQALWLGDDGAVGSTAWRAVDSMVVGNLSAQLGKTIFRRQRPVDGNQPNAWFHSSRDKSFPSGEVTHITAIVTPYILRYHEQEPAVWALAALPAYVGLARMKSQAHWQTDVLAGAMLGVASGYWASTRDNSWSLSVLPQGFAVGYRRAF